MSFEGFSEEQPLDRPSAEGPPDDVLEEMALATWVYEQLAARGRELRFRLDPPTGRVTVDVHDSGGTLLYTILPSEALEVAGGERLDEV